MLAACGSAAEKSPGPAAAGADAVAAADSGADASLPLPGLATVSGSPNFALPSARWYRGDLHTHTAYSDADDEVATVLAITAAWEDPAWLAFSPEAAGNGLDFVAITDHRTAESAQDPAFHHDRLILIPGEEYGATGHAGIWGLNATIDHAPKPGQTKNERQQEAVEEAHAMGALFSPNHPLQDITWHWDVKGHDAIEVWNGPWAAFYGENTLDYVQARGKEEGALNPYVEDAVSRHGGGNNWQALHFWYNHLTDGVHVAPVGGGDRHMILPVALPTTYVRLPEEATFAGKQGREVGPAGILAGIAAGSTFISRSPLGAQVDLSATGPDGKIWPLGAKLPGPGPFAVKVRVGRAAGGLLRLYGGPLRPRVNGKASAEVTLLWEQPIGAPLVEGVYTWQVEAAGGWLHAMVLEPLVVGSLPPEGKALLGLLEALPEGIAGGLVVKLFMAFADMEVATDPALCDPKKWQPWQAQCMPVDKSGTATFHVPDGLVRLINRYFENGKPTEYCMGAISAAFLVEAKP